MMSGSLLTVIPAARMIWQPARTSGSPSALFERTWMVPPETVMRPVNELLPERLHVPDPPFVSEPAPVWIAALIAKFPEPASARFIPLPVMLVPLTVSVPPLFVQVCAAAPFTLVMPPVPMVSVFVPPIVAVALP